MPFFSKLFGGGEPKSSAAPETHDHKGFTIAPDPIPEGHQFRIAATITKEIGGETKTHRLIRADTLGDHGAAQDASLAKAKLLIDQQGDKIFD